jgi:hypothetical protein
MKSVVWFFIFNLFITLSLCLGSCSGLSSGGTGLTNVVVINTTNTQIVSNVQVITNLIVSNNNTTNTQIITNYQVLTNTVMVSLTNVQIVTNVIVSNNNITNTIVSNICNTNVLIYTNLWTNITTTSVQAQSYGCYLADSSSLVTITLPVSPNIGDTVQVSGVGTGGWKIAQNAGQCISTVNMPEVNNNWSAWGINAQWSQVVSSADGSRLTAIQFELGQGYESLNAGTNWTALGMGGLSAVACSSDGTRLAGVIYSGKVNMSLNAGTNWATFGSTATWTTIAVSSDGTRIAASCMNNQIFLSQNAGTNWTNLGPSLGWVSMATSSDGTRIAAAPGSGQIYISLDAGTNWTNVGPSTNWASITVSSDGTRIIAASSGGQIYISLNAGTNWTASGPSVGWTCISTSSDATRLAAVATNGQIYISANAGTNWISCGPTEGWTSVASSSDGSRLSATVFEGQIYTATPYSSTIGTGGSISGVQDTAILLQYAGNGVFNVLSYSGNNISIQ